MNALKKYVSKTLNKPLLRIKEYDGIGKNANAILLKRYVDKVNIGKNIKPLINQI